MVYEQAKECPVVRFSEQEIERLGQALVRNDDDCFNDLRKANKLLGRVLHCLRDEREDIQVLEPLVARWLNQQGVETHGQRGSEVPD